MAAAEKPDEWWLDRQRVREERMRFEVLHAIYHAAERIPCVQIDTFHFMEGLGVWREELDRVLQYLIGRDFLSIDREGLVMPREKGLVACLTQKGIDYIQREARRRRTIRDEPSREQG